MKITHPILFLTLFVVGVLGRAQDLYRLPAESVSRVSSFENLNGEKGQGAKTNQGAKGGAFQPIPAGTSKALLDIQGSGVIQRIWVTVRPGNPSGGDPAMLRSLRLQMFWDGAEQPAVDVPFGDFFGAALGRQVAFQSALFSNPEARSFNCYIPMPFRTGARVVVKNESAVDVSRLFFEIDYLLQPVSADALYFHAFWSRQRRSAIGQDFELLPRVEGRGRFLGTFVGVNLNPAYPGTWYGEGEVKMFLDGDTEHPTIAGTGKEDYIGTGWGEGVFTHLYQGCTLADTQAGQYAFYRFHVPDAIYFRQNLRVILQQIGGGNRDTVVDLLNKGVALRPISAAYDDWFLPFLDLPQPPDLSSPKFIKTWINFYRTDDYSATSYFYLDRPTHSLPALPTVPERLP